MKTATRSTMLAVLACGTAASASAHPSPRHVVQHRVVVAVGPAYIDVTVDLTFHEHASAVERARIDTNGDGRISRTEIESHLAASADAFEKGLRLTLDDTPVELVPLADPALDLMGDDRVRPRVHALRLSYFARTPPSLGAGVLALRDHLWPEAAALRSIEIGTTGAFRCTSLPLRDADEWRGRCRGADR